MGPLPQFAEEKAYPAGWVAQSTGLLSLALSSSLNATQNAWESDCEFNFVFLVLVAELFFFILEFSRYQLQKFHDITWKYNLQLTARSEQSITTLALPMAGGTG